MTSVAKDRQTWNFEQFSNQPNENNQWNVSKDRVNDINNINDIAYNNDTLSNSTSTTPSPPQTPNENLVKLDVQNHKSENVLHNLSMPKPTYSNKIDLIISSSPEDYEEVSPRSELDNDEDFDDGEKTKRTRSIPTRSSKRKKSDDDFDYIESSDSKKELYSLSLKPKRSKFSVDALPDSFNIDITSLLRLPQKEAANKLGISESMLCKRFKESTKRKWPFRYLRKIEKTIANLKTLKKGGTISRQEQNKLDDLLTQKRECLAPVKIRITNHDRLQMNSFASPNFSPPPSPKQYFSEEIESDDEEFAAETLGLLRSMSPKDFKE